MNSCPRIKCTEAKDPATVCRRLLRDYSSFLSPNDAEFFGRVFQKDLAVYTNRLRSIGFESGRRILDGGCGFGQWSLCMSGFYDEVHAVDVAAHRLLLLDEMARRTGITNIRPRWASLTSLPYEEGFFADVYCYGSLFLTDWKRAIRELHRVLAPRGRIYFSANGVGWYVNLFLNRPHANGSYDPQLAAAKAFHNTALYRKGELADPDGSVVIDREEVVEFMRGVGFSDIKTAGEGRLGEIEQYKTPFFADQYYGLPGCYEVLARKGALSCPT